MHNLLIGLALMSMWSISIMISFFLRRDNMRGLISTWNHDFQPELWPELHDIALERQKEKAWRIISLLIKYYIFPLTIGMTIMILKGDFFLPTVFLTGKHEKTPRLVLFLQALPPLSFNLW